MLTIIIADDNKLVCESIKESVLNFFSDALIFFAFDGTEVLKIINEKSVSVIIMDIDMPLMNGLDAANEIKRLKKNCKIICTSSYKTPQELINLTAYGVKGFIQKGCKQVIYKIAIETVLLDELYFEKPILELIIENGLHRPTNESINAQKSITLTEAENKVLNYLKSGLANNLIAKELNIEISTVEKHLTNIYKKFNVKNREELKKK
ncbi:MAG: response regulator [Bacteroidia bacterium]|jgi:DNA-binding NarL/FixJ family response regulator